MADVYRYRCGECAHVTAWGSQSSGAEAMGAHYARNHPRVMSPGGLVEYRVEDKPSGGGGGGGCGGCLVVLGIVFVLLLIASRH